MHVIACLGVYLFVRHVTAVYIFVHQRFILLLFLDQVRISTRSIAAIDSCLQAQIA